MEKLEYGKTEMNYIYLLSAMATPAISLAIRHIIR